MLSITALLAQLRVARPDNNVFATAYHKPRAAKAWAALVLATADFIEAVKKDDLPYSLALKNIDFLRSSFPSLDVEAIAEEHLKNNPPKPKPVVPAMPADVEKLTEAEQEALVAGFAKALEAMPTAEDPFDTKDGQK